MSISDTRGRTLYPAIALFLLTAAFMVIRTGRDALYFQEDGLFALPRAYIAIAILAIPQAMVIIRLLRKIGGRRIRTAGLLGVTGLVAAFYVVARPGGGPVMTGFFVAIPLMFSVLFSMVWLLGAELFENLDSDAVARAYSRLGAASIIGGIAGGALARGLGSFTGPKPLLVIGTVLVLATAICCALAHRSFPLSPVVPDARDEANQAATVVAAGGVFTRPHVPLLLAIAMTAALSALFIEFQFYLTAATSGKGSEGMTVFFANVYLVLNIASLVLQLAVTPRLQGWLGLSGSLMVLPLALFGGAAAAIATTSGLARAGLRIAEGGLKSGVHRSLWEQAFLLFPRTIRPMAKVLIDGLGARIAEGLAAGILYVWLTLYVTEHDVGSADTSWVAFALIGSTALWLGLTQILRLRLRRSDLMAESPAWQAPMPEF